MGVVSKPFRVQGLGFKQKSQNKGETGVKLGGAVRQCRGW